jgi:hypothetical protein
MPLQGILPRCLSSNPVSREFPVAAWLQLDPRGLSTPPSHTLRAALKMTVGGGDLRHADCVRSQSGRFGTESIAENAEIARHRRAREGIT